MKRQILIAALGLLAFSSSAQAEESGDLDWSAWQRMPVLQDGRIMPLDSFARAQVKDICGEVHPRLGKLGSKTNAEMSSLSADELKRLASEGKPRQFLAAELLYSWTVEPEKWDDVPFLIADDETLRAELDLPLRGADGSRLSHVSPRQLRLSKNKFDKILAESEVVREQAQKKNREPQFSALQKGVRKLAKAGELFVQLSYDPGRTGSDNLWLRDDFVGLLKSWERFAQAWSPSHPVAVNPENLRLPDGNKQVTQLLKQELQPCLRADELQREISQLLEKTNPVMREFAARWSSIEMGQKPVGSIEPVAASLRGLISEVDAKMRELAKTDLPDPALLLEDDSDAILSNRQNFARWTAGLNLQAAQLPWGLYSAGDEAVSILPSLEATALEADRYRSEIHPWISLQALLRGSSDLLHGYPPGNVEDIRAAWRDARTAYLDRDGPQRARRFAEAIQGFTSAVSALAVAIEPDRQQLPIVERDRGLLSKTAYPAGVATDAEVLYNRVDPFYWSEYASLAAAGILGLSFLALRKPLFWTGIAVMVVAVVFIASGFMVRMYITRWAPVTSMFETVVWVAMSISLLTLWVTFVPLLGPTSKAAWGLTALRGRGEASLASPFGRMAGGEGSRSAVTRSTGCPVVGPPESSRPAETTVGTTRAVALALRLLLFVAGLFGGLCYMGVLESASEGPGYRLGTILPRADLGASTTNLSAALVWAASMFVAAMFVWYLPRIIPSALLAIPMSLALAGSAEGAERMEKIYRWRGVALCGALASFLAALAAIHAPFPKDIEALNPVLRSNFWLGIHVLTITTSYAAAGVAWMIGNMALGFFAFGPYVADGGGRRPPAFCGTLASLNYRVLQVTVLLLAAGTILGGLWADVSWGRFWGWDPKEVGALIALLLIMTALHGRRAGWHGDLSLAIGSVLGFGGVIWAWYVVNFILKAGLHAYGQGDDGQWVWLVAVAGAQFLFMVVAVARVMLETGEPAAAS